jgi:hypothetical protein
VGSDELGLGFAKTRHAQKDWQGNARIYSSDPTRPLRGHPPLKGREG